MSKTTRGFESTYIKLNSTSRKAPAEAAVRLTLIAIAVVADLLGLVDNSIFFRRHATPMYPVKHVSQTVPSQKP